MWWKKPYASGEPVVLTGHWADMIGSCMYMSSDISHVAERESTKRRKRARTLYTLLHSRPKCSELEKVAFLKSKQLEPQPSPSAAATQGCIFELASEACLKLVLKNKQKTVGYGVNSEKDKT